MRRNRQPLAVLIRVQIVAQVGAFVIPIDAEVGRVEHFAQLVADQIDDRLEVELSSQTLLDRIDDRELGVALLCFFEQALRLIE